MLALLLATALLAAQPGSEELLRLPASIEESSGVVVSSLSDDVLFTHNDSGDDATFYAVSTGGELLATYALPGVQARDWEDMARGPDEQGASSLWLGDIGDNNAARDQGLLVHRVPEPEVDTTNSGQELTTPAPTSFRLRYDDGPRDAEALLVHPRTGRLYVISKEVFRRPGLYAAPERLDPEGPNVLRRVAELDLPRTTTAGGPDLGGAVRVLVTAGDIAPDGSRVAVRTYTDVYEWSVADDDIAGAVEGIPAVTPLPPTEQGEALAYTRDGSAVVVTTEGTSAPVQRVTLAEQALADDPPDDVPADPVTGPPFERDDSGVPWSVLGLALAVLVGLAAVVGARRRR